MIALILFLIHSLFILLITILVLFNNNIKILFGAAIIILITLMINYKVGDCPISKIEDIFNDNTSVDILMKIFLPNKFQSKLIRPLIILNMLWIGLILVVIKILILYTLKTFTKYSLKDELKIYISLT